MRKRRGTIGYESKHEPLLSRHAFAKRLVGSFLVSTMLVGLSLAGGMVGYHNFESMPWIDAFANASMILSGMGPLCELHTFSGKLFAGLYALYSGLILVVASGIVLAPFVHRILHRFHLGEDGE